MANQAALTCLDFQHIKQVGLSIEVTLSVSAEGGKGRGRGASLLAAPVPSPSVGQKENPWAEEWRRGGVLQQEELGGSLPAALSPPCCGFLGAMA